MEFTKIYNELKDVFSLDNERTTINGSGMEIRIMQFKSNSSLVLPSNGIDEQTLFHQTIATCDENIEENRTFSYPVFVPKSEGLHNKAIVLLHGLNERSWLKYLPWAYYLSENTNRPVILFPIAFHMNRSPEKWANPRAMMPLLSSRQQAVSPDLSTFANVALSQRLSDDPLRFFASGKQSSEDITRLLETIKKGEYPLLAENSHIDFFSYSIGAFLSQILFIANPKGLFDDSRLFMFCGGAYFSEMYGASRLIMDSQAFANLRKYYLGDFLKELKVDSPFSEYVNGNDISEAFVSMISPDLNADFRQNRLEKLSEKIRIIGLKKDQVIPSSKIKSTFSDIKNRVKDFFQELDFPYKYSHEVPFPVFSDSKSLQVDDNFNRVFQPVVEFLA
ncbi:MAG TPA: DUF6051 family protein [Tenuifilaceae bacterium]|nr:DUF6051 family protein [Tenuifilaceae bacterium]